MPTLTESPISADAAKGEFLRSCDRVEKALASTPDDKVSWSPSPTARTPLELAAHCAMSIPGMQSWLAGEPFPFEDMKALDEYCRKEEKNFKTREQVLNLLHENRDKYITFLDGLSAEKLGSMFETQMGTFPMMSAITFPADHVRSHAAQIDYVQTIYGDREMHM